MSSAHGSSRKGIVEFFPISQAEVNDFMGGGTRVSPQPRHQDGQCGHCGRAVSLRIVARLENEQSLKIGWCLCPCEEQKPMVLVLNPADQTMTSFPAAPEFRSGKSWPPELAKLFDEAALAHAAGAFTASVMASRKLLMACACHEGEPDGKPFAHYVDFITSTLLASPKAKAAVDAIRTIGNDANHKVEFTSGPDAHRALNILQYLLNFLYSLPTA